MGGAMWGGGGEKGAMGELKLNNLKLIRLHVV
jgi:hypothetical protein